MSFSFYAFAALLAGSALAAPQYLASRQADSNLSNFYIVTTAQQCCNANSSALNNVSATSFLSPFHSDTFNLRQQGAGYLSIPSFNLTADGTLQAHSSNGFGQGDYIYGSQKVADNTDFTFAQNADGTGISIASSGDGAGCLIEVNGSANGWTVCPGSFGQSVISYQGTADGCVPTYLQAVIKPPY